MFFKTKKQVKSKFKKEFMIEEVSNKYMTFYKKILGEEK